MSMTSLIDVIFLLLLFFMLSSTFSRFGEVKLEMGGAGAAKADLAQQTLVLVRLAKAGVTVNGQPAEAQGLPGQITQLRRDRPLHLVVSVTEGAQSQALVDVLHRLRGMEDAQVTVVR
jgi:biopolymer transport protein ExbD